MQGKKNKKEGGREEGRKEKRKGRGSGGGGKGGRLVGRGAENFLMGTISAQADFYLLEVERKPKHSCLLCPGHSSAMFLFQMPCDAIECTSLPGLGPVGSNPRNPFPTRCGCPLLLFANIRSWSTASHSSSIMSRHYLIDKGVPLSIAAVPSSMRHTIKLCSLSL